MNLNSFISKNIKWIAIICFILFCLKSIQSCSRKTALRKCQTKNLIIQDSLKNIIENKDSIIKELNFDVKTFKYAADASNEKARSIQAVAEKIKANTTIKIQTEDKENKENK